MSNYGHECRLRLAQASYIEMLQLHGKRPSSSLVISLLCDINLQLRAKDGGINSDGNFLKDSMERLLRDSSQTCADLILDGFKDNA
jgi:hypothetical protein